MKVSTRLPDARNGFTEGKLPMSHPKVITTVVTGGATAASLPVTGSPIVMMVLAGAALVVGGFLMLRAGRFSRTSV